jgi:hypothetical protein
MRAMASAGLARWGGFTVIGFAAVAVVGLALWFTGADLPKAHHSAADLTERVVSIDRSIAGAWVLILAMVILAEFSWWLMARYGNSSMLSPSAQGSLRWRPRSISWKTWS